jgi:iron complex outermembrane receptor protein
VVNYTTVGSPGQTRQELVTYRVGVSQRFNDNIFAFGSVSTGFKAGAFQEQPGSAILARSATAPERVTNYEVGIRTDWLDRHLRFNVSAFIAKYRDFQTIQVIPDATAGPAGTRVSVDTGDATIKGIETELVLAPADWVDLNVRYTYLDAVFDRLTQTSRILADGSPVFRNLAGMRMSRTPRHALNVDLGLTTPRSSWGWLRALVSMGYQSELYDDNDNDFIEYRRPRTLWDASLTYNIDERFSVQLWGRNLTDVEYRIHQSDTGGGLFVVYGPPRQMGVTFNAAF